MTHVTSDEQFEDEMNAFARQLEVQCKEKVARHARKLKPNFEDQWITKLKIRLQKLENRTTPSNSAPAAASKTAPPPSSSHRKH